jgi:hypothetical protein
MCAKVPKLAPSAGMRAESATGFLVYRLVHLLSRTGRPCPAQP